MRPRIERKSQTEKENIFRQKINPTKFKTLTLRGLRLHDANIKEYAQMTTLNKTSTRSTIAMINEKLLTENRRHEIFKAPVVKTGSVIYNKTLELMTTFMGIWKRKNVDSINYIQMSNLQQSTKADSSGPFIYLRSILHYELIRDDRIISTYNPNGPSMSYISSDWRANLFNRMIQLQQHIGFSTETEHLATVLVDRYTWRRLIDPNRYDLLGMVAISLAAKITCRRRKMAEMELKMIDVLEYDLVSPIPHTFLGFAIAASLEVLEELGENEYFLLARYIFELGLTEMALSQCSASLKCAAAIYLIRHLLRLRGQRSSSNHHLINLSPWTKSLTAATGHKESKTLRCVAYSYGLMLIEAQFFLNDIAPPGKMTGCTTKYKAAFDKYIHENSAYVAMHPLVSEFTTSDIECLLY